MRGAKGAQAVIPFLSGNWGTVLVLAAVLAAAAAAARRIYKNKKAGRSGCGCGCGDCPSRGICRRKK